MNFRKENSQTAKQQNQNPHAPEIAREQPGHKPQPFSFLKTLIFNILKRNKLRQQIKNAYRLFLFYAYNRNCIRIRLRDQEGFLDLS